MQLGLYGRKTRHTEQNVPIPYSFWRGRRFTTPQRSVWVIRCSEKKMAFAAVWPKPHDPRGHPNSSLVALQYCTRVLILWMVWALSSLFLQLQGGWARICTGKRVLLLGPQEIQTQCSSLLQSLFLILDKSCNFSVIQFVIPVLSGIHILPENEVSKVWPLSRALSYCRG